MKNSSKAWMSAAQLHADKDMEIEQLRQRIEDAETALRVWDHGGESEYWLRHPDRIQTALFPPLSPQSE